MGTNQSKTEKEVIIAQAGNSGGATGLQGISFNFWEVVGILFTILLIVVIGYYLWRCNRKATRRQIRREISKSQDLAAIGISAKNIV